MKAKEKYAYEYQWRGFKESKNKYTCQGKNPSIIINEWNLIKMVFLSVFSLI